MIQKNKQEIQEEIQRLEKKLGSIHNEYKKEPSKIIHLQQEVVDKLEELSDELETLEEIEKMTIELELLNKLLKENSFKNLSRDLIENKIKGLEVNLEVVQSKLSTT